MHLLSFRRRIVSAGLLLMVIDWIFENCYRWMDGGGQAIGTTVQLGGACMAKLRKMVYDSRKEG